ncbi:MAG: hypothetical protein RAO75_07740 [Candidatus Chlorobium antarcticum]|nr:hypothetical protein [Candidatus Chlorobium antarcticum]
MPDTTTQQVNFVLAGITTDRCEILSTAPDEQKPVKINAGLNFGIDSSKKLLKVLFRNEFLQDEIPFITIEAGCIFAMDEESWKSFINDDKKLFALPKPFAGHLAQMTAGTARGILHAKTENTPMNRFMIPATNVEDMIRENVILSLKTHENNGHE